MSGLPEISTSPHFAFGAAPHVADRQRHHAWADIAACLDSFGSAGLPGCDFNGGQFVPTEQRPGRQSQAEVALLIQGDAGGFTVHNRPVEGERGSCRVAPRHGVIRIRPGQRHTLAIIFHDAR